MLYKKKLFYIHTPKTAGSSLNKHFAGVFPSNFLHVEGVKYNKEFIEKYDFVSGHITYNQAERVINEDFLTMVTLREPYSYVVSHLCWIRKLADEGQEKRFLSHPKVFQDIALKMKSHDFSKPEQIRKFIAWLEEIDFNYLHNTQTLYLDGPKRVRVAIQNLNKVNFVGTLESIDEFTQMVSDYFGVEVVDNPPFINKNSNKYGFDLSCLATRLALEPLLDKDVQLYKAAKELFQKTHSEYIQSKSRGDDFKHVFLSKKIGRLAGIDKGKVFGWARVVGQGDEGYCNLDVYINNSYIATVRADEFRHDLNIKHSRNCAFFIDTPNDTKLVEGDIISVRHHGSDIELDNSPLKLDKYTVGFNSKVHGRIGGLVGRKLVGWARYAQSSSNTEYCLLDVYHNDKFLVSTKADKYRKRVRDRFGIDCAFEVEVPANVTISVGDEISIRSRGELNDLGFSPLIVKASYLPTITGRLGGVSDGKFFGWAMLNQGTKAPAIKLCVNDIEIDTVIANVYRKDLIRRFGKSCGFEVDVPSNLTLSKGDVITAQIISGENLENSPLKLNKDI